MDNKIKHLEMILGVINRMASNSFMLKGWAVTLIAGIFALSGKDSNYIFFLVAYIPIIVFWLVDSYYLQLERRYTNLYNKVRKLDEKEIDFSMSLTKDLDCTKTKYLDCLISISEILFYIPSALLVSGIIIFIINK